MLPDTATALTQVRQSLLDHQKHATLVLDITQHALGDGASLLSGIADAADPRAAALWDFVVLAITRPPDPPAAAVAASFRAHLLLRARSALASEGVVPATLCHVRAYALLLCGDLVPTAQESRVRFHHLSAPVSCCLFGCTLKAQVQGWRTH